MDVNWGRGGHFLVDNFLDNDFSKRRITIIVNQLSLQRLVVDHTIRTVVRNGNCDIWVALGVVLILVVAIILSTVLIIIWLAFVSIPIGVLHAVWIVCIVREGH